MRSILVISLTLSLIIIIVGYTNFKNNNTAKLSEYNSPPPLLIGLENSTTPKEEYIKGQLAIIKFYGRNKKSLDIFDYHLRIQNQLLNARMSLYKSKLRMVKNILKHDLNYDMSITLEELKQSIVSTCMIISMGQIGGMVSNKCNEKESIN